MRRFQIHLDRVVLGIYGCEAASHQVKSEFSSQNCQYYFKVSKSQSLPWLLLAATTVEI